MKNIPSELWNNAEFMNKIELTVEKNLIKRMK